MNKSGSVLVIPPSFPLQDVLLIIVQEMDQHHTPIRIFLDMVKAFATLNQEILSFPKMAYYDDKGSANTLRQSYLSERLIC